MTTDIFIALKIQTRSAEALARQGIRANLPAASVKSKLFNKLQFLCDKYQLELRDLEPIFNVDRIYAHAQAQEQALLEV